MKNVTIVYLPKSGNKNEAIHIPYANKDKIQRVVNRADFYMIDHIIVQYKSIAVNDFKIYTTEDDIVRFINEWDIDY